MRRWVGGRWAPAVVAVSAVLLLSVSGAIVAAPLTVPVLFAMVRTGRVAGGLRVAAVAVAALTVAEVAWAAAYLTVEGAGPWIWPLAAAAGAGAAGAFLCPPAPRPAG